MTTRSRIVERYTRPGQLARRGSRSVFGSPSLNLRGPETVDAILHGQARKAWLEVRGDAR